MSTAPLHPRRLATALTLVELLVTVVLCAVIALLAFTSSRRVINDARSARCMTNLRQLHSAFMAYAGDHQKLPCDYLYDETARVYRFSVYQGLEKYIILPKGGKGYAEPYLCPADAEGYFGFSYGVNAYLCKPDYYTQAPVNRLTSWKQTHTTFLLADAPSTIVYANASARFSARHNGYVNLLFLDGHIEKKLPPFTDGSKSRDDPLWNPTL